MSIFGNNRNQAPSVNTNIETFFGKTGYLKVGLWDDKVTFTWVPATGTGENGRTQYDKDKAMKSFAPHAKIESLLADYRRLIEPKVINKEDPGNGTCVGITARSKDETGQTCTNGIFIEYRKDEDGKTAVFFTLGKNPTENGCERTITHKFADGEVIVGAMASAAGLHSESSFESFLWFISLLKAHTLVARYPDHTRKMAEMYAKSRNGDSGSGGYSGYNAGGGDNDLPFGDGGVDFNAFN